MLLAGDVGGTKVDLGIFSAERGPRDPLLHAEFPSADYPSLTAVVREFLAASPFPIERACFDVAGPVIGGGAKVTNLSWNLSESELAEDLQLDSVRLLNDLEAIARAVPALERGDLRTLNPVEPTRGGAIAVIAPGTGLGESFLTLDGSRYVAHPSEGGHADFAPTTDVEAGLLAYLRQRLDHVSVERVCSGIGIPNLYSYLRDEGLVPESALMAEQLAEGRDRTRLIAEAALRQPLPDPLCAATLELFVSILGSEAGNLALKVLATGGVYLAGGIPTHILPALEDGRFMRCFTRKGRLHGLLRTMPVHVVLLRAALIGAALYGLEAAPDGIRAGT